MQSLILATSLLLSSQAPITQVDTQELSTFVSQEVKRVSTAVNYHTELAAKDTILSQAKLVISQARKAKVLELDSDVAAE